MRYFVTIALILVVNCSFALPTQDDLYNELKTHLIEGWEVERSDYGLHYSSKIQIKNPEGKMISAITLDVEGPVSTPKGLTIEEVVKSNVESILNTSAVNPQYKPSNPIPIAEGIGAAIVDINGQHVGIIDYEVPSNQMIFIRHGLILKEQKLYTFTMIFFDSQIDRKQGKYMEMLMIAAVNSGKL